jgi:membrane-associated phospholipid phosphatase
VLLWLHRRRPDGFPFVRTALLLASGRALVGFLVYPTAPPRLAGVGILGTVSGRHVDLNRGLVSAFYNPYAAMPSMHIGYALLVAVALLRHGRRLLLRGIGALYPSFVLLVIVATGNHFFLDAAAGALVAGLGAALAALLIRRPATARLVVERRQLGDRVGRHDGCLVLGRG